MRDRSRFAATVLVVAVLLLPACGGGPKTPGGRVAFLYPSNLTGDQRLDWLGAAAAASTTLRLSSEPVLWAFPVASSDDAYLERANHMLEGYYTREHAQLRFFLSLRNLKTNRAERRWVIDVPGAGGVFRVSDELANSLGTRVLPPATKSLDALRAYAMAATAADTRTAAGYLHTSIDADADFGAAYVSLAELLIRERDGEAAEALCSRAAGRRLPAPTAARLEVLKANLSGDQNSRLAALEKLASLTPADADIQIAIGNLEWSHRNPAAAARWFGKVVALEPDNANAWNLLAYAQAYQSHFQEALGSLGHYRKISPGDPNAFDSIGEISFLMGNFPEAEQAFLAASKRDPDFLEGAPLLKAAYSRLFAGDVEAALTDFQLYADYRRARGDQLAGIREVKFRYLCGKRTEAIERMKNLVNTLGPQNSSFAATELAIWSLLAGDRRQATAWADTARQKAGLPQAQGAAALAEFVTQPPASASEWAKRAETAFPAGFPEILKKLALGYALVLDGHFGEAALVWKEVVEQTPPVTDCFYRAIYGWCLFENGSFEQARRALAVYPLPSSQGIDSFLPLVVPRYFELRAELASKAGHKEEAARAAEVFSKLGGAAARGSGPPR